MKRESSPIHDDKYNSKNRIVACLGCGTALYLVRFSLRFGNSHELHCDNKRDDLIDKAGHRSNDICAVQRVSQRPPAYAGALFPRLDTAVNPRFKNQDQDEVDKVGCKEQAGLDHRFVVLLDAHVVRVRAYVWYNEHNNERLEQPLQQNNDLKIRRFLAITVVQGSVSCLATLIPLGSSDPLDAPNSLVDQDWGQSRVEEEHVGHNNVNDSVMHRVA